jgi:hypothetical protein
MSELLYDIQRLQFTDRQSAESLLLAFIRQQFALDVIRVELRPLAVSLNSFNGFLTLSDSKRLFFKSHVESGAILNEYYKASQLADCGYPMIQPLYQSTEAGRQLLIYDVIEAPTVFDVAWAIEQGDSKHVSILTQAQHRADDQLISLYKRTLEPQSSESNNQAAIHQLFYHRLTGERLKTFYADSNSIELPGGTRSMGAVRAARWVINGVEYRETLNHLIATATDLLNPLHAGPSILGHGDAHNGNVFMQGDDLIYFDPAFAGRHHPLLDLTKPLFHNVHAMWMYHPHEKANGLTIHLGGNEAVLEVEHDYQLHPIRTMFLQSKIERVLKPILRVLKARNMLRPDWKDYLKAALFCCPFLTMRLTDNLRFPATISLLGLAMSIEMGGHGIQQRSSLDQLLDSVELE